MKFQEQFPKLKIKLQARTNQDDLRYTAWTMERLLEDIQKYCLDKQRFRDVIYSELRDLKFRKDNGEEIFKPFENNPLSILVRICVALGYEDWILKIIADFGLEEGQ